jgi:hypothetical protein
VRCRTALSGDIDSQSTGEVEYSLSENLRVSGRFVTGATGEAFQGGASWDTPFGRLYAQQTMPGSSDATNAVESTLVGAEAPFGAGGTVFTEYQWDHSGEQRGLRSIAGMRRDWRISDGLALLLSGEQTMLESAAGSNEQNALIGGLSYNLDGIKLSSSSNSHRSTTARSACHPASPCSASTGSAIPTTACSRINRPTRQRGHAGPGRYAL